MEIFEWKNGTKTQPAKVEINGQVYVVQDAQYDGETPVSASNLNEMQRILNANLSWKLVGSAVGSNRINIPSNATEILVIAKVNNNANLQYTFTIPTTYLTTSVQGFNSGYFQYTNIDAVTRIGASSSQVYLAIARSNQADVISNSSITVYYR